MKYFSKVGVPSTDNAIDTKQQLQLTCEHVQNFISK